jgi:O-antigen/teichoic acid export membrane protein
LWVKAGQVQREGRHVLSHAGIYLLARGLPGLASFVAIAVFSRLLKPGEYGRFALVIAIVDLLNAMLFQWLRLALVRYLPAYRNNAIMLSSTLLGATAAIVALLGACVGIAWLLPLDSSWRAVLLACWILVTLQAMFELTCEYTRASLRPRRYMLLQVLRSATGLSVAVALVWAGCGWWAPLVGIGMGYGLAVAFGYRREWRGARLRIDRTTLGKLSWYGVPVSLTVAMTVVIASSDRFLITLLLGPAAAGVYAAAVDLTVQTASLLMMAIYLPMFPLAVHAFEQHGLRAAQKHMRANAAMQMGIGLPAIVGLMVLAPGVAHCVLGESFRAGAQQLIPLVALAAFFASMKAFHFDAAFQLAHKPLYQLGIVITAAMVNVSLNLILIPRFGLTGAATASLLSYLLALMLTVFLGRRYIVLPIPFADAARVFTATALMAAALYPFRAEVRPIALMIQVICGVLMYGIAVIAMNFMGLRNELMRRLMRPAVIQQPVVSPRTLMETQSV